MEHKANESCIQPGTFSADEAALTDSTQAIWPKSFSAQNRQQGSKRSDKSHPLPGTAGRSSLENHRQQTFTAPCECAEHKYSTGKRKTSTPRQACALVHVALVTQEFVFAQLNLWAPGDFPHPAWDLNRVFESTTTSANPRTDGFHEKQAKDFCVHSMIQEAESPQGTGIFC